MNRIFIVLLLVNIVAGLYNLSLGTWGPSLKVVNTSVGCLNFIVSIMVCISILKIRFLVLLCFIASTLHAQDAVVENRVADCLFQLHREKQALEDKLSQW